MGGWQALLEGEDAERAREAAVAITTGLAGLELDPGLYSGHAGVALLHGYRARCGDAGSLDAAADALGAAAEMFAEEQSPWLAGGFAGVAFAIAHLSDLVEAEPDTLPDLDSAIASVVDRDPWPFPWELAGGLIGLGVYGLERAGVPGGRAIVERTVGHLAELAERSPGAACWRPRSRAGCADDMLGAISFLAAARASGVPGDPSLLADSVAWLLARDPDGGADLAFGAALIEAGLAAGERAWIEQGVAAAARAGWTAGDLSLCHGGVGHGHLLNRLAQATGASELADRARAAYRAALAARRPGTGIGGFTGIDLQHGAAGIALGLLAASSEVAPDWDRAFLMAIAPRA